MFILILALSSLRESLFERNYIVMEFQWHVVMQDTNDFSGIDQDDNPFYSTPLNTHQREDWKLSSEDNAAWHSNPSQQVYSLQSGMLQGNSTKLGSVCVLSPTLDLSFLFDWLLHASMPTWRCHCRAMMRVACLQCTQIIYACLQCGSLIYRWAVSWHPWIKWYDACLEVTYLFTEMHKAQIIMLSSSNSSNNMFSASMQVIRSYIFCRRLWLHHNIANIHVNRFTKTSAIAEIAWFTTLLFFAQTQIQDERPILQQWWGSPPPKISCLVDESLL